MSDTEPKTNRFSRRQFGAGVAAAGGVAFVAGGIAASALNDESTATAAAPAANTLDGTKPSPGETPFDGATSAAPSGQPNIVFILADDMGFGDASCYGAPSWSTPAIDQLARDGIRFTDGYATSAVCSPTRMALYTGRYPGRLKGGLLEPIGFNATEGLPTDEPTIPKLLRAAGYHTAMIGKWNCGFLSAGYSPIRSGFDEFFGSYDNSVDYFSHKNTLGEVDLYEGEQLADQPGYYTELVTDRAVKIIDERKNEPFYLQVNYNAPHWPWEGPDDEAESARLDAKTMGLLHQDGGSLEVYARMMASLDDGVGKIRQALSDAGIAERTIVVFSSDNGGEEWSYMWPLAGAKFGDHEGGIRVPLVVAFPGHVSGNQYSDTVVDTMDLAATFLSLAGTDPDPSRPLDGTDLAPWLFNGAQAPSRDHCWRQRNGWGALRRGEWKYVKNPGGGSGPAGAAGDRLYDLSVDPREGADLFSREPEIAAELKAAWDTWNAEMLPYS